MKSLLLFNIFIFTSLRLSAKTYFPVFPSQFIMPFAHVNVVYETTQIDFFLFFSSCHDESWALIKWQRHILQSVVQSTSWAKSVHNCWIDEACLWFLASVVLFVFAVVLRIKALFYLRVKSEKAHKIISQLSGENLHIIRMPISFCFIKRQLF